MKSLLACILSVTALSSAYGECDYEVTLIEAPPAVCNGRSPDWVFVWAINEAGTIVVGCYLCPLASDRPFMWQNGEFIPIDLPDGVTAGRCYGVNDRGQITGTMGNATSPQRAFLVDEGALVDLGVPSGGVLSEAFAINEAGQIAGHWTGESTQAFLWSDGEMRDLSAEMDARSSKGRAINDGGRVAGARVPTKGGPRVGYTWCEGTRVDLPPIPGGYTSEAWALNARGHVAGRGRVPDPDGGPFTFNAFFWKSGAIRNLGTLPLFPRSRALGLNNLDVVVGDCSDSLKVPATGFIWRHGTMQDLSQLLPRDGLLSSVTSATDLNDNGQIVGHGVNARGRVVGFIMSPVEASPTDISGDCVTDRYDLLLLLADWGVTDSPADFSGDGVVNVADIVVLLSNWHV